jgi:hypothetical protein
MANGNAHEQWNAYSHQHHPYQSHTSSPLAQHAQVYTPAHQAQQRFQQQQQQQQFHPSDMISEAALRELIASSRTQEQQNRARMALGTVPLSTCSRST